MSLNYKVDAQQGKLGQGCETVKVKLSAIYFLLMANVRH